MILTPTSLAHQMLCFPCSVQRLQNGDTLIADAGDEQSQGSKIIQVDQTGRAVWQFDEGLCFAHAAERLTNGDTLIADTNNNRILQVNPQKQIVFSSERWGRYSGRLSDGSHLDYPNDVHSVFADALLITDRNNNRVVLVDRKGNLLNSYTSELLRPHNADLLPNGNILVANSERQDILELSPQGDIVWRYGVRTGQHLSWPRDADRLADGTTLITDSKNCRVLRVDAGGNLLWEYQVPYFANFYEADSLDNGHILISDQQHQQVFEIDTYGSVIWCFRNHVITRPIGDQLVNGELVSTSVQAPPAGWILNTRLAEGGGRVITDTHANGCACSGIAYDRNGIVYLQQLVGVKPGTFCLLTGDLRTEGLAAGAAYMQLAFVDEYGGYMGDVISQPRSRMLAGTTEWIACTVRAEAPARATAVEIRILISGPGSLLARNIRLAA